MQATFNRFSAFLDADARSEPEKETINEDLLLSGPVTYSFDTHQWSISNTRFHLKSFNLQNITANKKGLIFIRFENEARAKQVIKYITKSLKIQGTFSRVQNNERVKCFHCYQNNHWGSECQESIMASFPQELMALISADLQGPDLFALMFTSKMIFNTIITRQKAIIIARPFWRSRIQMKLNLGLIQRFSLVDTMKFRSLCCLPSVIPVTSFKNFKHLTSLSIVNCRLPNDDYMQSDTYFDGSTLKMIGQLRKLKKLDLDYQLISMDNLGLISGLVNLTQLRISFARRTDTYHQQLDFDFLTGLTNLRKLSLNRGENEDYHDTNITVTINEEILTRLRSLYAHDFTFANFPKKMPFLEKAVMLTSDTHKFEAPNLTKLVYYGTTVEKIRALEEFHNLEVLTLHVTTVPVDLSFMNLKKLTLQWDRPSRETDPLIDLGKLISLEILHIVNGPLTCVKTLSRTLKTFRWTLNELGYPLLPFDKGADLECKRFELLMSENISYRKDLNDQMVVFLSALSKNTTLEHLKLDHSKGPILSACEQLTQLKVLDLVTSSNNLSPEKMQKRKDEILALSSKLPNTKIIWGNVMPATIRRPSSYHWYSQKLGSSGFIPYECGCEYCKAIDRGYYENAFDDGVDGIRVTVYHPKFTDFWYL